MIIVLSVASTPPSLATVVIIAPAPSNVSPPELLQTYNWEEVLRIAGIYFAVGVYLFFVILMASLGIKYRASPPTDPACKRTVVAYLDADAWLWIFLTVSFCALWAAKRQIQERLLRPCCKWFALILFVHVLVSIMGFAWLSGPNHKTCPRGALGAGWFFLFLFINASLAVLLFGCCRRKMLEKEEEEDVELPAGVLEKLAAHSPKHDAPITDIETGSAVDGKDGGTRAESPNVKLIPVGS